MDPYQITPFIDSTEADDTRPLRRFLTAIGSPLAQTSSSQSSGSAVGPAMTPLTSIQADPRLGIGQDQSTSDDALTRFRNMMGRSSDEQDYFPPMSMTYTRIPSGQHPNATIQKPSKPMRQTDYGTYLKQGGTVSWRNNNPGNIKGGTWAKNHGAIGTDANGFAIFPTEDTGQAAEEALWRANYGDMTLADAAKRWSYDLKKTSQKELDTYINGLSAGAGVDRNTLIKDLTPEQFKAMIQAQKRHEGYKEGQIIYKTNSGSRK
jgi:ribosomal protein L35AE/L33A